MPSPVVHFEIGCKDSVKSTQFYKDLFDWEIQTHGPANMVAAGTGGIGGHIHSLGHEPHNYITIYAQVDDLQASLDKAETLGGKTLVPPTPVPGMGHFAWLADPEGTIVGIWKPDVA